MELVQEDILMRRCLVLYTYNCNYYIIGLRIFILYSHYLRDANLILCTFTMFVIINYEKRFLHKCRSADGLFSR
jgi:hypothetical protein